MRNKSNLVTIGCSVAEWDHSRSVLYDPLESYSAQYQPLWIRRSHLSMTRFCELDPSPCEHRNWLLCHAGCRRQFWHCSLFLGGCKAHSNGKVKALPSTEDKKLYDIIVRAWCRDGSFQCSVLPVKQRGLCILLFQDPRWVCFCGAALVSTPSAALPGEFIIGGKKAWNYNIHF